MSKVKNKLFVDTEFVVEQLTEAIKLMDKEQYTSAQEAIFVVLDLLTKARNGG